MTHPTPEDLFATLREEIREASVVVRRLGLLIALVLGFLAAGWLVWLNHPPRIFTRNWKA